MPQQRLRYIVDADTRGFGLIQNAGLAAAAAVATGFAAAVRITADFERQLSVLRGVSGATREEMDLLENQARDLGRTTEFTATQVAQAQTELARLGFTTNEILNSSGGVLDLALGLSAELGPAAELVGATLRQFQLDSSETGRVVDVLAESTTTSALNFERLRTSLAIVAPVANTTGASLERTVTLLGLLANAGVDASTAGTSLRRIFIDLNEQGLTLEQALDQVAMSADPLGTAVELVGVRAATALSILSDERGSIHSFTENLENAQGAARELADEIGDNLVGDVRELRSALEGLAIDIGQTTDGPLRLFIQTLTDGINNILDPLRYLELQWLNVREAITEALIAFNEWSDRVFGGDSSQQIANLEQSLRDLTDRQIEITSQLFQTGGGGFFQQNAGTTFSSATTGGGGSRSRRTTSGGSAGSGANPFNNPFNQFTSPGGGFSFFGGNIDTPGGFNMENNPFTMMSNASDDATENIMSNNSRLEGSFVALGAAIASSVDTGSAALDAFIGAVIPELVRLALANAVTSGTQSATGSGPAAAFLLPALIAGAVAAVTSGFNSVGVSSSSGTTSAALSSRSASGGTVNGGVTDQPINLIIDGATFSAVIQSAGRSGSLTS